MPCCDGAPRTGARSPRWSTFARKHATAVLACDFFVAFSATFRVLYVFVVLDVGTRRIRLRTLDADKGDDSFEFEWISCASWARRRT
jgi:hypothetical protein